MNLGPKEFTENQDGIAHQNSLMVNAIGNSRTHREFGPIWDNEL